MKKQPKSVKRGKEQAKTSPQKKPSQQKNSLFPIVGIGASAVGLEALEQFLLHMPENNGMTFVIARNEELREEKNQRFLEKVLILLRMKTGHDFSLYKKNAMYRRIERRMGIHQIERIGDYVRYLQENSQEVELLFKELLIGVTNFFRDPAAWDQLRENVFPSLLANRPSGGVIRAWSAGCSTGEEAYSLAIVFKESLEQAKPAENFTLQVSATDLDRDAIDKALQGVFPANIAADVTPGRLRRFFVKEETGYRVTKNIRAAVTFAIQNVIMDPPFTKLDILICRNLLIYLSPEMQKKLLRLFHYSLKPGGILFLGSAESINNFTDLFEPLDLKSRLFRRRESIMTAEPLAFLASIVPALPDISRENARLKKLLKVDG